MEKWKDFSIGGYNFNDYSLVKELYLPTDVAMNPARTLHVRGREALPHHLQHYFIPYGKVFLGLKATVRLDQVNGIGLLGTHFRWRKGVNPAWDGDNFDYWANIRHVLHTSELGNSEGAIYICTVRHNSSSINEPGVGINWRDFWEKGMDPYSYAWASGQKYVYNQFVSHDNLVLSGYLCQKEWTHIAGEDNYEPGVGANWETYWNIGDEMQADLSWPYYEYEGNPGFVPAIKLSEGKIYRFSRNVIGKFRGWHYWPETNQEGRALDALATTGYMKQDGILWGVEVDDEEGTP